MSAQTYQSKYAAMRDFHYHAADLLAKEAKKARGEKRAKLLRDCSAALELAEKMRALAKAGGTA